MPASLADVVPTSERRFFFRLVRPRGYSAFIACSGDFVSEESTQSFSGRVAISTRAEIIGAGLGDSSDGSLKQSFRFHFSVFMRTEYFCWMLFSGWKGSPRTNLCAKIRYADIIA